jgi:hypothetical protein
MPTKAKSPRASRPSIGLIKRKIDHVLNAACLLFKLRPHAEPIDNKLDVQRHFHRNSEMLQTLGVAYTAISVQHKGGVNPWLRLTPADARPLEISLILSICEQPEVDRSQARLKNPRLEHHVRVQVASEVGPTNQRL